MENKIMEKITLNCKYSPLLPISIRAIVQLIGRPARVNGKIHMKEARKLALQGSAPHRERPAFTACVVSPSPAAAGCHM